MMPTTFKEFILPCKNNKSLGNLLFIHGFCVDHTYFTAANKLSEHFDVYMIDLPGHGTNNDNITPKDLKLNKMAQYIVDYINFKKLDNIYLMGHSMGGALVSLVERLIPTKIKKLILVCPANPAAIHAGLKSFYIFYPKNMEQKTRLLRCLYAPNNFDTYSKNPAWMAMNQKQLSFQLANWKNMKKLFHNISWAILTYVKKAQKQIQTPTLLMVGKYDQTIPAYHTLKFFKKHLPEHVLTTYQFDQSGHLVFEEEEPIFIDQILKFVK